MDTTKEEKPKGTTKKRPKLVKLEKHTVELISPNLHACKIETKDVGLPPALRQRHIQLQALEARTCAAEPAVAAKVTTVENEIRQRKKSNGATDSSGGATTSDDEFIVDEGTANFDTYLVVEFSPTVNRNTLHWIVDKIRKSTSQGGAGLLIRCEPQLHPNQGLTLHLSADNHKFLQLADELELMKPTRSGVMKSFNISYHDDFFINDKMEIDNVLTLAEKQMFIKYALDNIRAIPQEKHVPNYEQITLYHGQSLVATLLKEGLINHIYSLRDPEYLRKMKMWYTKWLNWQPLDQIREYFGESVGIYFAFVEFHTIALAVPAFLGFFQYFCRDKYVPYFCAFYVIWMIAFLEFWKRKCSVLAYRWGTITMTNLDLPRIGFYGKIGKDKITGRMQPQYPMWKTYATMYCISLPVIVICMLPAAFFALSQFWLEDRLLELVGAESYWTYLPSIVESIIVTIFSSQYEKLATWLTDLENHRTQAQYERHRVIKLIVLEFVNNFLSLIYIAFWLRDVNMISNQLMTQLIVFQIVQKLQGAVWPIFLPKLLVLKDTYLNRVTLVAKNEYDDLNIAKLDPDDHRIKQSHEECNLLEYDSTYEDYLEMYIQFGYVVLFAAIAPFAAVAALLNNWVELKIDAYKLCCVYKRPFAKRTKNTGAWTMAFGALLIMSIVTNCGILYLQPEIREYSATKSREEILLAFVIAEHLLLGIAWILNKAIPERPWSIRVALAKADYESRQAVKRENTRLSRNVLYRRFYSLHIRPRNKFN